MKFMQTSIYLFFVLRCTVGWGQEGGRFAFSKASPGEVGMDKKLLESARDYALTGGGSGRIVRQGKLVMTWGDQKKRYDLKSTTKSFGATALGVAIGDGKIKLTDKVVKYHPTFAVEPASNMATGWIDDITIFHLATQTAGFEKPGGYGKLQFAPGTEWCYSDGGPNWLAECLTLIYQQDLLELMFERVFGSLGIGRDDLTWRRNSYRPAKIEGMMRREFGSGIHANVEAMSRVGYLYLLNGKWQGKQLLPKDFIDLARRTPKEIRNLPVHNLEHFTKSACNHYGLLWWNNNDGALKKVPRDTYWSWGLYESLIVVMPSLDIVVARAGKRWKRETGGDHYSVLAPFFEPIVASVKDKGTGGGPYPASPVIRKVTWAPKETIVRKAKGSDNWPVTWGDDDALYTAYGDGWGFEPKVEKKLSMGLAKIIGGPADFQGINLRSTTAERMGQGAAGPKASGMLMVDGVLYMLVRNVGNSQIVYSKDRGKSWTWCDWKFTTSFGVPTFLNYGKNYAGARDEYVYIYSSDSDSAYKEADRMILARAPKERILEQGAYEYFVKEDEGKAVWSKDIQKRGAVFIHKGNCYRSGITYNVGLRRYLWCQVLPASTHAQGSRFAGGFGIYDAPASWGPWTTVFYTENWDVGPGETNSLPTKWMSSDGRTYHLVFSGDDCFSVRRVRFHTE